MAREFLLSDVAVRSAKPTEKIRRLMDGGGLFLAIDPSGSKRWEFRYRFSGKDQTLALGAYPDVTLAAAREKHQAARKLFKAGLDPTAERKAAVAAARAEGVTFGAIVQQWLDKREPGWSASHIRDTRQKLNRYIIPRLGMRSIAEVERGHVREILDALDAGGNVPTLQKVRGIVGQVFRFAINQEIPGVTEDPTLYLRGKGTFTTHIVRHRASLTESKDIGALMLAIEHYADSELRTKVQTGIALKFSALTFCRPGEIAKAAWTEIDFRERLWRIPAAKMKMHRDHLVPLAEQTLALLDRLKPITGHTAFLFVSERTDSRSMSAETVNAALRRMGFARQEMTSHGFRGMASTQLNELGWNADWVEMQLAHAARDKIRSAYNAATYLDGRRAMMQFWADRLDKLMAEAGSAYEK